ncbi:MAG: hypothetical protein IPM66_07560 [Acidobacteriota bacterium]|nr:MAG: hypothetical protein IPM66_07560 [Acidobacteriota bacterium]
MHTLRLSTHFSLRRRYTRSINLERDLSEVESLQGYVITATAEQALKRIVNGFAEPQTLHAWMLTGVYGAGKSAFAHFLASLCASARKEIRKRAEEIHRTAKVEKGLAKRLEQTLPEKGLVRAVVTAQREPVSHAVVRALSGGINHFWHSSSHALYELNVKLDEIHRRQSKGKAVENHEILQIIQEIASTSQTGVLLVIDELGKCLEYAAQQRGVGDLYLLQQIAELPNNTGAPVYLVGLLHQAFSEYGYGLGTVERNEWAKIQGRFEEIPFTGSATQMAQMIGQVICREKNLRLDRAIAQQAEAWYGKLSKIVEIKEITAQVFDAACPLHPTAALVLPQLCIRYAQNDRSLFTFLTSAEPHSLQTWLNETDRIGDQVPLLKLDRLYDYFIDSVGIGTAARLNLQRWAEVKSLIDDHRNGEADELRVLKTIGILNLAGVGGFLKAARELVVLSLCDAPADQEEKRRWNVTLDHLLERGLVMHRRQVDELRIWEGSDFDIEAAVREQIEQQRTPLATLLADACPLRPVVAQRHSYQTGTLRFFERRYLDSQCDLATLRCENGECDGLIGYWVDDAAPALVPEQTADHKPLVLVEVEQVETLRRRALELMALKRIQSEAAELQADGIARREVRYRVTQARQMLDEVFAQAVEGENAVRCWIAGQTELIQLRKALNPRLSGLCDTVYQQGLTLLSEMVNRQELTSQGAKASRQVIEAMIERADIDRLGLSGDGPEVSVYYSVLERTGIHRAEDGVYGFHRPQDRRIHNVWSAIENFCLSAKEQPVSLDRLYHKLKQPPYGVKSGLIPLLFAAVILKHVDDVSFYRDGAFIPVLGPEHFELFVKNPVRFAVKHYEVLGLRAEVFKEIEAILSNRVALPNNVRNRTLLGVISPLLQFARRLPSYTQKTKKLSPRAQAVRQALLDAHEPDKLLFELLPKACDLNPITEEGAQDANLPREFRARLSAALRELREAYDNILLQSRDYLHEAFGVAQQAERLRENLRVRASFLQGRSIEPILTRFVFAATDDQTDDAQWLKAVVMVISDKPSESWTDADAEAFELKLADVARRFKYLEAIAADNNALWTGHAEARRISLIGTDGKETCEIAWIDERQRAHFDALAEGILQAHPLDMAERRGLLAVLAEKILNPVAGADAKWKEAHGGKGKDSKEGQQGETHSRHFRR